MEAFQFQFSAMTILMLVATNEAFCFHVPVIKNTRAIRQVDCKILSSPNDDHGLLDLERKVKATAQARLDLKRVSESLELRRPNAENASSTIASRWQIALAAAAVASAVVFVSVQSNFVSGAVFLAIFSVANRDPLEEEGVAGSSARLLGRFAINSVEVAKPKLKAVARAAITSEEEIFALREEIASLRDENETLRKWKARILAIDERGSEYNMEELKGIARKNAISIGGSKRVLMMRLLEAELIEL